MKFFVVYNGTDSTPERRTLKLSEAFGGDDTLELKAEFININAGKNEELLSRSIELSWYCAFVERVKHNQERGLKLSQAIKEAMEYCIRNGIMAEYLRAHEWEVAKMYQYEYDAELAKKASYEDGYDDGEKHGMERGLKRGMERGMECGINFERMNMVQNLYRAGTPINFIMTATGWTEEQILAAVKNEQ